MLSTEMIGRSLGVLFAATKDRFVTSFTQAGRVRIGTLATGTFILERHIAVFTFAQAIDRIEETDDTTPVWQSSTNLLNISHPVLGNELELLKFIPRNISTAKN